MKTRTVEKTSVFPSSRKAVFQKLQQLSTLQQVAYPYATFESVDGKGEMEWEAGADYAFRFRLLGFIPFGTHRIHVARFSEEDGIYTNEGNEHVPIWKHEITLRDLGDASCEYTDRVEIGAGWKTGFIYLWAKMFYAHRQRKWKELLEKSQ
ncbi:hypothetical protein [Olsenella uli]|uniref:hypothetical protein n=1 Tax=Olsenella uli TaxID=133926 RepID=UPI000568A8E7|nr:hypothetical protein [Olsenella uli]